MDFRWKVKLNEMKNKHSKIERTPIAKICSVKVESEGCYLIRTKESHST
jgi:hypothetical protein